jgi:transcriptional regulator with XRE-family HTH domain
VQGKELRSLLSSNIKAYRLEKGYSQAELAEKADISIPFLSAIECCNKWPHPETLAQIAEALSIDVFQLFKPPVRQITNIKAVITQMSENVEAVLHKALEDINQCC